MNKKYHFDITPHIVKQLGEQLVPDEVTALLELIKNSYDADASYVSIEINTTGSYNSNKNLFYPKQKGFIAIEDDGFGMDEATIMKSWLLISYSNKRVDKGAKLKTPKGRTPLGDKGLGRLSTQRLANICEIFTNKVSDKGTHIAFNWKDFEKEEALTDVKVKHEVYLSDKPNGTLLLLTDLNNTEVWKGDNLEKFKGQIIQVISPYKDNRPFEVYLKVNGVLIELDYLSESLSDLSISNFSFNVTGNVLTINGRTRLSKFLGNETRQKDAFYKLVSPDNGLKLFKFIQEKIPDIQTDTSPYFIKFKRIFKIEDDITLEIIDGKKVYPGDFYGIINEFSYKEEQLKDEESIGSVFGEFSSYKIFTQAQIGIKIYRNGFAVLPYGIDGNKDWLGLSSSQTKTSYYDLRPDNVTGYIAIDEGTNHNLKDKTDRSGLISTPSSRNFFALINFVKDHVNQYQRSIRKRYTDFISIYNTNNNGIKTVTQAFNQLKETKKETEAVKADFRAAIKTTNEVIKESSKVVALVHDNPMFATNLEKEAVSKIQILLNTLTTLQETLIKLEKIISKTENLNEVIDLLEPKIRTLEDQLSDFTELASLGLTAETIVHEFASIGDRLAERASFYSQKLQIKKLTDSDIYILIEYINTTVNGLKTQLKHLDPALKYSRDKKTLIQLSSFFLSEREYYQNRFEKNKIKYNIEIKRDFSITINKGKLVQVIDNLLNNSEYWLLEKKRTDLYFKPVITIKIEEPWIYIYDNGYGISPSIESQIFEPFVTTKPKGAGRGLGLFIIQQLLDSFKCGIVLEPTQNENNRKYIFAINFSNILDN